MLLSDFAKIVMPQKTLQLNAQLRDTILKFEQLTFIQKATQAKQVQGDGQGQSQQVDRGR